MLSNLLNAGYNVPIGMSNSGLGAGIENKALPSINYSPLESSINGLQPAQNPEDMPEAVYTPWGIWIHKRDPLHSIIQRFDTEHMIRSAKAAEDILHYAHYVPVVEGPNHETAYVPYGVNLKYDYSREIELYNFAINLAFGGAEDIKLTVSEEPFILLDEDSAKTGNKPDEPVDRLEEPEEPAGMLKAGTSDKKRALKNFNLAVEEQTLRLSTLRLLESLFNPETVKARD